MSSPGYTSASGLVDHGWLRIAGGRIAELGMGVEVGQECAAAAGAEDLGLLGEPAVGIFGGQVSELACSQCRDDVLVGQDPPGCQLTASARLNAVLNAVSSA
ncbi:hypothetical protein GCM10010464_32130 [Pseudonocardia yunnanensis]